MATYYIQGLEKTLKSLKKFDAQLQKKILRQAMRAALKPIKATAKADAPVLTGQTRAAIKIKAGKQRKKGCIRLNVVIGEGDYKGDQFYGSFQEYGYHNHKTGKLIPGKHFMKKAFDSQKGNAKNIVEVMVASGISSAIASSK